MATNALTCSASTLVSNNMASRRPLPVGLGRHSVLPPTPSSKAPSSRPSLVVKAQRSGGTNSLELVTGEQALTKVKVVNNSPVITEWNLSYDQDNEIRMWAEMPGIGAENTKVYVENRKLTVETGQGRDVYNNKIFSPRHTEITLPCSPNKEYIEARFKNGVLYITVTLDFDEYDAKLFSVPVCNMGQKSCVSVGSN